MKRRTILLLLTAWAATSVSAQQVISVGKGSYASYAPLSVSRTTTHGGDQSQIMQYRKLNVRERDGQPIPTNDWWTNMINGDDHVTGNDLTGHLWSYPLYVQSTRKGIDVKYPNYWIDNGTEMKAHTKVTVGGKGFAPNAVVAEQWHDWDVEYSTTDGDKQMYTTMVHGMPFTWIEMHNIRPTVTIGRDDGAPAAITAGNMTTLLLKQDGTTPLTDGEVTDGFIIGMSNATDGMEPEYYGVFLPEQTTVRIEGGVVTLDFYGGSQFVVVGVLPTNTSFATMKKYAYSVPRNTEVTWAYDAAAGKVRTQWDVTAESLNGGDVKVLQGFLPHHYRDYQSDDKLGGAPVCQFRTPHGMLKMMEGASRQIDYNFYGMLPYYPVPEAGNDDAHPYQEAIMQEMLSSYASSGTFGADTYWGGKGLTQMALNMMFAREMGKEELYRQCHDKLKAAMVNWMTYTPGEDNYFFARDERFGGMVGYATSYDSETYNDHHFHYGYFTLAGALLALVDNDFRDNYGQMLRLVAKDYANWERTDSRFPLFRTFDPWSGHSFAGGLGDGNGNGQESTSEAMQGWGGLYLLGVALKDDAMRDAGLFGWVSEARGTAEYWFDRHKDTSRNMTTFHTKTNGDYENGYNIDYSKFSAGYSDHGVEKTMTPPYNSNLTCHGVGYWTYFGFEAVFMQGIQWMPISPALDYLSEDKEYAAWDIQRMLDDTFHNGFLDNTGDATLANSDWGNVALSYYQRSNPQEVARIFDEGWAAGYGTYRNSSTNGITYFVTHSHLTYGDLDWNIRASIPTARVYIKQGVKTYTAYNPTDTEITVNFSDGGELTVPARSLAVSGHPSKASTTLFDDSSEEDPRETLIMEDLARGKTATASSSENQYSMPPSYVTDGDNSTRWSSTHHDGEWIAVDLGKEAKIYRVRLNWEAAYASTYKIQTSNDGSNWTDAATENGTQGWVTTLLGDVTARYVRVLCVTRASQYGISLFDFEVNGQWNDAAPSDLLGVRIAADSDVLKQNQQAQVSIEGYTVGKTWTSVSATWSSTDGTIDNSGLFTPTTIPSATVKATVGTLNATKTFPVEEARTAATAKLSAATNQMAVGESQQLTVVMKDQFGKTMTTDYAALDWRVCTYTYDGTKYTMTDTPNGAVDNSGRLSFTAAGDYAVIVTCGTPPDTTYVSAKAYTDINLALNKPTEATSVNGNSVATLATDGKTTTRWESVWQQDPQMLTVDLRGRYSVNKVVINWENACAKKYKVQYSTDASTWYDIADVTDGAAGIRTFDGFGNKTAQYIRIYGTERAMEAYGYSIIELEVYGTEKEGEAQPMLRDLGEDTNHMHQLAGKWNASDFEEIERTNAENGAVTAYDLRDVSGIGEGTSFDLLNPNAFVVVNTTQQQQLSNSKNVVVDNGDGTYATKFIGFIDGYRINKDIEITANSVSYHRTLGGTYATMALPFDYDVPADMKAYELTGYHEDGSTVTLTFDEVTTMLAGKPYIIEERGKATGRRAELGNERREERFFKDGATTVSFVEKTETPEGADADKAVFHANFTYRENVPGSDNIYTMNTSGDGILYHMVGGRIPEFRGYFTIPESATGKECRVEINDADGILRIEERGMRREERGMFNLSGQRVSDDYKGIVIKNGRKIKQ